MGYVGKMKLKNSIVHGRYSQAMCTCSNQPWVPDTLCSETMIDHDGRRFVSYGRVPGIVLHSQQSSHANRLVDMRRLMSSMGLLLMVPSLHFLGGGICSCHGLLVLHPIDTCSVRTQ